MKQPIIIINMLFNLQVISFLQQGRASTLRPYLHRGTIILYQLLHLWSRRQKFQQVKFTKGKLEEKRERDIFQTERMITETFSQITHH